MYYAKIWKRDDIDASQDYCFVLYQSSTGLRNYGIARAEELKTSRQAEDFAFATGIVPIEFIMRRDVFAIAENSLLSNGEKFYFDSDAIWHLSEEWDDLLNDRKPVRWFRGLPPTRWPR